MSASKRLFQIRSPMWDTVYVSFAQWLNDKSSWTSQRYPSVFSTLKLFLTILLFERHEATNGYRATNEINTQVL